MTSKKELPYDLNIEIPNDWSATHTHRFWMGSCASEAEAIAWVRSPPEDVIEKLKPGIFLTIRKKAPWILKVSDAGDPIYADEVIAFSRATARLLQSERERWATDDKNVVTWEREIDGDDVTMSLPACVNGLMDDELQDRMPHTAYLIHYSGISRDDVDMDSCALFKRDWVGMWDSALLSGTLLTIAGAASVPMGLIALTAWKVITTRCRRYSDVMLNAGHLQAWALGRSDTQSITIAANYAMSAAIDNDSQYRDGLYYPFTALEYIFRWVLDMASYNLLNSMDSIDDFTGIGAPADRRTRSKQIADNNLKSAKIIRSMIDITELLFAAITNPEITSTSP